MPASLQKPAEALRRSLPAGAPVCYWHLSAIEAVEYDVEPAVMHGEMDAQFFLTKEKNFIPHEYPCRSEFVRKFRDKRPEPGERRPHACVWLPFGSPRVDLSGFWFRATRLNAWADTVIEAESAGRARLRLSCCGGAILWINGVEAGFMSRYQRNYETTREFEVELARGRNDIMVYFDDLAERDTRYFFELDYLDGPEVSSALPVACNGDLAAGMEHLLEEMHFDKPAYNEGTVAFICPVDVAADLDVNIVVEGDFLAQEKMIVRRRLARGQRRLEVGTVEDFHSDFRHFDVHLIAHDHEVARPFTVEISHRVRQGQAPATLSARIDEALEHVALHGYGESITALARLARSLADDTTDRMIEHSLPRIERCFDCADFHLVPLLFARIRYGHLLSETMRTRIDEVTLGFRYWLDEPGNDVQWYFSENHALLFHTSAYLAGHFHAGSHFTRSGRTGSEQSRVGAERLRAWFDHFERWEMAEFNSVPYFPVDLKGLTALYALAHDEDIRARAGKAIVRLIAIVAASAHQGTLTGAQGRSYEHTLMAARTSELSAISRVLWGRGWYGRCFQVLPQLLLCLRDGGLEVPEELAAVARLETGRRREWRYSQGKNGFAHLYHYKTSATAMGSLSRYRWGEWGYQETVLQLRVGDNPDAQIWINHPGEVIHCGFGRPSYWGGCGTLPRVHQYRNLAVVLFEAQDGQPAFSHIWFPRQAFEEALSGQRWIGARCGSGMVRVAGSGVLTATTSGPTAGNEIRQNGRKTAWLVRLGDDTATELADFCSSLSELAIATGPDGTISVEDPEYGLVIFAADGGIQAEGRVLHPEEWSIAGEALDFA